MSRHHDYNASYMITSDTSREIASGLPTVVVDMFLDDACPEPSAAAAVNPPHLLQTPTGAPHRNEPPHPPHPRPSVAITQSTCEAIGNASNRVRGCSRVVHRYHLSSQPGHHHPPQQQQQQLMYSVASTTTTGSPASLQPDDETKRRKNREAAARCRQRKSERIVKLEEKAKQLKEDNEELEREAAVLQHQIVEIRNTLLEHMHNGCPIRMAT